MSATDRPAPPPADGDDVPPSLDDSLRLIREGQATAARLIQPNPLTIYVPWGVAWFVGYGLLFLRYGAGQILGGMPGWLPYVALSAGLMEPSIQLSLRSPDG